MGVSRQGLNRLRKNSEAEAKSRQGTTSVVPKGRKQIQQFSHHPLVVKGRKRRAMIHFLSALRFALRKYRRAAGPALAAVLREE